MSSCEHWGPMISAKLDGELSDAECIELDVHLEQCADCREQWERFAEISTWAQTPEIAVSTSGLVTRWQQDQSRSFSYGWLAAAACLLMAAWLGWRLWPSDTQLVTTDSDPVANLQWISQEEENVYEALRDVLVWELRTLRLELDNLDISDEQSREVQQRIADLIDRVDELTSPSSVEGESI